MSTRDEEVEALTRLALEAAEMGRWDAVLQSYEKREALLAGADMSVSLARRLHAIDCAIHEKVRVALVALGAALGEIAAARRRMSGLERQLASRWNGSILMSHRV
ncbi:MAG: hypothetical protein AB1555_17885 [Nitrospirota bacterium]